LLGNGHSELEGSGSAGSAVVAAGGTPLGSPGIPDTLSATRRASLEAKALGASDPTANMITPTASNASTRFRSLPIPWSLPN
jgi:hypothetical protein